MQHDVGGQWGVVGEGGTPSSRLWAYVEESRPLPPEQETRRTPPVADLGFWAPSARLALLHPPERPSRPASPSMLDRAISAAHPY